MADFLGYEMVAIVGAFAEQWDSLARVIPGRDDYRLLIKDGYLVRAFSVIGQLTSGGALELVQIELDLTPPGA